MRVLLCICTILTLLTNVAAQDLQSNIVPDFSLEDFYGHDPRLSAQVDSIFEQLSDTQRVAQMIIPAAGRLGKPTPVVANLVSKQLVGGVLLLNGTVESFTDLKQRFDTLNAAQNGLPLIYSADAEPSLVNRKIKGTKPVKKTNQITSNSESSEIAATISTDLSSIGILYNYAPVCDMGQNQAVINNRSHGTDMDTVIARTKAFVTTSQQMGIVTTAKHFPGHGYVKGDSHHNLVYIDGELRELPVYEALIEEGVLSIMVGHIAVKNNPVYNTDGQPATCSRKLVTGLLKEEMGFKGLVITDAMGMGGVSNVSNGGLQAIEAGCDIILMPVDEAKLHAAVIAAIEKDEVLRTQVYASVRKVIRMKICLGLL